MVGPNNQKRPRILAPTTIPDDLLIAEVLIHLPAKSLARCRCVCRSWRAGIAAAAFVRRHRDLSRARPPSSVLAIPRRNINDPNHATTTEIAFHRVPLLLPPHAATEAAPELVFEMTWPEGITRAVHPTHCDGLVAVSTTTDRVFVCNPATGEFVALPLGTHNAELDHCDSQLAPPVAIGFDQWRNRYVVARYFYRTYGDSFFDDDTGEWAQEYDIGHEVFTLGVAGGGSWELTDDPPHAIIGAQRPICTRRAFYWHSHVPTPRLVRFGLRDRAFEVVARPPTTGGEWNPLDDMAELDGKLCYVHAAAEAEFHVWMADDGPDDLRWSLRCRVHLPDAVPMLNYDFLPVLVADDGDTLVTCIGNTLYRCSLQSGTMEQVVDMERQLQCGPWSSTDYVVPYFDSLLSITACNY